MGNRELSQPEGGNQPESRGSDPGEQGTYVKGRVGFVIVEEVLILNPQTFQYSLSLVVRNAKNGMNHSTIHNMNRATQALCKDECNVPKKKSDFQSLTENAGTELTSW